MKAIIVALSIMAVTGTALAENTSAPASTGEPKQANHVLTSEIFVRHASQDGMLEVEAGKLALSKSNDAKIKSFAQRMVTDHGNANAELMSIAGTQYPIAKQLDKEHQAKLDALSQQSGEEFDHAYSKDMMRGHADAVKLFTSAAASEAVSPELKQFASKTLPTLKEHRKLSMKLMPGAIK